MAEAGFPVDMSVWFGLIAREGTPRQIIERLNREVNGILRDPKFVQQFATSGIQVEPTTPEQFSALIKDEAQRWPAFMRTVGVIPE